MVRNGPLGYSPSRAEKVAYCKAHFRWRWRATTREGRARLLTTARRALIAEHGRRVRGTTPRTSEDINRMVEDYMARGTAALVDAGYSGAALDSLVAGAAAVTTATAAATAAADAATEPDFDVVEPASDSDDSDDDSSDDGWDDSDADTVIVTPGAGP